MKVTKFLKLRTLMMMLIVSSAMIFGIGSCNNDDDNGSGGADKTAINALIAEAESLASAATAVDYPQTAIDAFKTTLASVKTSAGTNLTQVEVNNLATSLNTAMTTFKSKAYGFIDETLNLAAGWHFDEGTGTTATAFSTVKHVATFKNGNAVFGTNAMMPSWVDGVKGGKAVYLNNGAHLEAPYNSVFLPTNLSISVWIKPIELYENNYILSQNFWQGYKLQTQGGGKPFFTYQKAGTPVNVDANYINADNETDNSIKVNVWNHIVITLNTTTKELMFYVNGTLTKTWTESTKGIGPIIQTLVDPAPQPFLIGGMATDEIIATPNFSWVTVDNIGYFKGAIDELKLYNIALVEGQVSKLYTDEKP